MAELTTATPFWFGPSERPLFGWMHLPADGVARGGVVMFPSFAIEHICGYFTFRTLADRLASDGLAVLRFDYDGTGDSFGGGEDPDRVAAWLSSGAEATKVLQATGVTAVGMIGLRMGGVFAARAALELGGVDALVLWDTCLSGRAFLREQQALRMLSLGGEDRDGAVEVPGLRFGAETVSELSSVDLGAPGEPLAAQALVLEAPGRARSPRLERRLEGVETTWIEAVGQEAFLDPPRQETPVASIEAIAEWFRAHLGGERVLVEPPSARVAVVGRTAEGEAVRERAASFGSVPLFGIVTEPEHPRPGPNVIFINEGNTPHIGQSRLWVELARAWGALGLRVLRFDLSGHGDSAAHAGQVPHGVRDLEATGDVFDAMVWLSPDNPRDAVLLGVCAGGYQAMEVGLAHRPRRICLVNPVVTFVPQEGLPSGSKKRQREAVQRSRKGFIAAGRLPLGRMAARLGTKADDWDAALAAGSWPSAVARRSPRVPALVWQIVTRLLVTHTAVSTFARLVDAGVETVVVCGTEDAATLVFGCEAQAERLRRQPGFELNVVDGLDHAVLIVEQRERVAAVLTDYILT